jgi:hypothetical protein
VLLVKLRPIRYWQPPRASLDLWDEEISFPDLGEDIAVEARLALALTAEIKELDERIAVLVCDRDPHGIITSALASAPSPVRSFWAALVIQQISIAGRRPSVQRPGPIAGFLGCFRSPPRTHKRGDHLLQEALFMSANQARRLDPTLAAKYHRLMIDQGKHHNSALCHIATALLTRVVACWRAQTRIRSATLADGQPRTKKPVPSSPSATPSPPKSAVPATPRGRVGEARSRYALHRPTRRTATLNNLAGLDIP